MNKLRDIRDIFEVLEYKRLEMMSHIESLKIRRAEIERQMQLIEAQISELTIALKVLSSTVSHGTTLVESKAPSVVSVATPCRAAQKHQSQKAIIVAIESLLQEAKRPTPLVEIYQSLVSAGVAMNYAKPQLQLSKILSGAKQFKNVRGQGWVLS